MAELLLPRATGSLANCRPNWLLTRRRHPPALPDVRKLHRHCRPGTPPTRFPILNTSALRDYGVPENVFNQASLVRSRRGASSDEGYRCCLLQGRGYAACRRIAAQIFSCGDERGALHPTRHVGTQRRLFQQRNNTVLSFNIEDMSWEGARMLTVRSPPLGSSTCDSCWMTHGPSSRQRRLWASILSQKHRCAA
jgi:hypothetical protein